MGHCDPTLPQAIQLLQLVADKGLSLDNLQGRWPLVERLMRKEVDPAKVDLAAYEAVLGIVGEASAEPTKPPLTLTILEEYPLDVEAIPVEEIERRSRIGADFERISTKETPAGRVTAAVCVFNENMDELQALAFLAAHPGLGLKGSGVWVREADIKRQPVYDGKGWKSYPDEETSRWRDRHSDLVYGPFLWHDWNGERHVWHRVLNHVRVVRGAGSRVVFVCESAPKSA